MKTEILEIIEDLGVSITDISNYPENEQHLEYAQARLIELRTLVNNLNFMHSSLPLKDNETPTFFDWWVSEGYTPTERPNVFKNGCNLILIKDLERKYKKTIKDNI